MREGRADLHIGSIRVLSARWSGGTRQRPGGPTAFEKILALSVGGLLVWVIIAWFVTPSMAWAGSQRERSALEKEIIQDEVVEAGYTIAENPHDKVIEWIRVVTLDVFDDRDPFPNLLNVFHTTTQANVIRSEFLFEQGDRYDAESIAEGARTLRSRRMLSVVLVVPVAGSAPDKIGVFIITKDTWSLRVNWDLVLDQGVVRQLLIQPSEENIAGTHVGANLIFALGLDTFLLGGGVRYPRIGGTWLVANANVGMIFNRDTGDFEGTQGGFGYGLPLYSRSSKWSWLLGIGWRDTVQRIFEGNEVRIYHPPSDPNEGIPYEYRSDIEAAAFEITRSFGYFTKFDLTLGVEGLRYYAQAPDLAAQGYRPEAVREFKRDVLPTNDTRVSPFLQSRLYTTRYFRVHDFNTLALQEDYRLGADILVRIYPASRDFVSTRSLIGIYTSLGYTLGIGDDGLARAVGTSRIELAGEPNQNDGSVSLAARFVTPQLSAFRLVLDAFLVDNYMNYFNRQIALGGDSRPRGYPAGEFIGTDAFAGTVELRTAGLRVLSAAWGAAFFYDVGDAFNGFDEFRPAQSVGIGLRALFPQANRIVLRADWGFPIASPGYDTWPGRVFVTFGQAFGMPRVREPSVVGGL